ncbi:hypothetical protein BDQ12DRAFT_691346 [Crucibulum laeve]|uniref:Uncharacterized protein n=1 Tax=Crucibulum laeve TaxID=68775 RepID=A0A5C3LJH2_9AGAR|nr:hypothetical protein BDQ12DRAFT_691346 [Crucibulum laeve]
MITATSLKQFTVSVNNNQETIDCVISFINKSMLRERVVVVLGSNGSENITKAVIRILLEISGAEAALQFNMHHLATSFVKEFAVRANMPDGTRISNPFRIASFGYKESIEELIPTVDDPGLFNGNGVAPSNYHRFWVKLSFLRSLGLSRDDRKLCEGEIQLLNFD